MTDDGAPLKSAYELAMERLAADDRKSGADKRRALTDADKAQIAEIRQAAKAKLAELEILKQDQLQAADDEPTKLHEIEEHYRIDRDRIERTQEDAVERIRSGED